MGEAAYVKRPPVVGAIHEPRPTRLWVDVPLLIVVAALVVFGLLMVYSASWDYSIRAYGNTSAIVLNQIKWVFTGLGVAFILSRFNYRYYKKLAVWIMAGTLILLLLVFILGTTGYGATRSLLKGSVQPSELAKLVLVIYLSVWLNVKRHLLSSITLGLLPMMAIIGFLVVIIGFQPDFSAALTICLIGILLFFMAGGEIRHIVLLLLSVGVMGLLLYLVSSKAQVRIQDYVSGLFNPQNASYHIQRCTEAIVRGGFFGVGIGKGTTKFTNLPVPWTDSIFAIIAEETGLLGGLVVIGLYVTLLWRGLRIAQRAPDDLGKLLAGGITLWIVTEAFINVGVIVNLVPFAGNALPLISAGGSNMVTTFAGIGILMNISRSSSEERVKIERIKANAVVDLRRWNRGRRVSGPIGSTRTR